MLYGTQCIEKAFATEIWDYINGQETTSYWTKQRALTQGIWKNDWLGVYQAGNAGSSDQPSKMGIQICLRPLCNWEKHVSVEFQVFNAMPKMQWTSRRQTTYSHLPCTGSQRAMGKISESLRTLARDKGIEINLCKHLMNYLWSWPLAIPPLLRPLPFIADQDDIGIQHIWDRWLCHGWRDYQDQIWKQSRSHSSSWQWTLELIKKL